MYRLFALSLLSIGLASCTTPLSVPDLQVSTTTAAVAMPDRFAADAAEDILQSGGNAIDAAIASALVLAVTYPEAGNIGGGGFMLIYADGKPAFLDYRETAPGMATRDMYLDKDGDVIADLSLVGHLAAGVPGTVAGLWDAHRRHGTRPWAELVAPALRLARDGFVMPGHLAERIDRLENYFKGRGNFSVYFGGAQPGQVFKQPELAATLERIARQGRDGFYRGTTAELIAADMSRGDGLISTDDLAAYRPVWREPLAAQWRDYRLISAPPPSMGGFAVIQLLKMKDYLANAFDGVAHNSPQYLHLVAEIEKRVFADRAEYFGDPDFVDVPVARLIDDTYVRTRADAVDVDSISSVASVPPGLEEGHDTTHFSVVDRWGNAVSNTYTLNTWFGSGVVVEGAGFLLNNEMDDFSAKPGAPNFYGVVGQSANAIEPRKRMLSSMSPTILLRDDKVSMVVGTPGGSTIFTSVFQAVVNILDFGMTPQQAVAATRFHHQLLPPDLITFSPGVPLAAETIRVLGKRGYRVEPHPWVFGDLQVIWYDDETALTGSDPRGRGASRPIRTHSDHQPVPLTKLLN
ncbi:MAG: gamma-glutamyltransferase [Gammaproteobacteria bacterium]|nr:gamma-glutamyltransferase [Gammaproteobacteria bacterium]MDH3768801.1 gamma-glutamyltransferase [Gammaproteobacteria bacterium]